MEFVPSFALKQYIFAFVVSDDEMVGHVASNDEIRALMVE
jgi:hypothetical protein